MTLAVCQWLKLQIPQTSWLDHGPGVPWLYIWHQWLDFRIIGFIPWNFSNRELSVRISHSHWRWHELLRVRGTADSERSLRVRGTADSERSLRVRSAADSERSLRVRNTAVSGTFASLQRRYSAAKMFHTSMDPNGKIKCISSLRTSCFTCRGRGFQDPCTCDSAVTLSCRGWYSLSFLICRCEGSETPCTCKSENLWKPLPLRLSSGADLQWKRLTNPLHLQVKSHIFLHLNFECQPTYFLYLKKNGQWLTSSEKPVANIDGKNLRPAPASASRSGTDSQS